MSEQTRAIDLTRLEAGAINRSSGDRIPNSFRPAPVRLLQLGARDQAGEGDWREYEQPLPEVLIALAQKLPGAFYDVGANSGFYAILLGRLERKSANMPTAFADWGRRLVAVIPGRVFTSKQRR